MIFLIPTKRLVLSRKVFIVFSSKIFRENVNWISRKKWRAKTFVPTPNLKRKSSIQKEMIPKLFLY
jgi:hypothetical protein